MGNVLTKLVGKNLRLEMVGDGAPLIMEMGVVGSVKDPRGDHYFFRDSLTGVTVPLVGTGDRRAKVNSRQNVIEVLRKHYGEVVGDGGYEFI